MYTILRSIVCVYVRLSHMILVKIKKIKNKVNLDFGGTITFLLSLGGGVRWGSWPIQGSWWGPIMSKHQVLFIKL